ncbi:hypothetical protein DFH06DRAFT_1237407 [Mycena polygramma]|nr:hypothetical protein DFH06DRAFT_1237407 [Mycena polygramma]
MLAASAREIKSAASQNNCWWSSGSLGAGSFIPALVSSTLCFLWEFYSPRLLNLWLLHPEIGLLISFFAVDPSNFAAICFWHGKHQRLSGGRLCIFPRDTSMLS